MSRLRPRWARLCLGGPAFGAGRKVHAAAAAKGVCHKSGKRESICRPQGAGMPRLSAAKGRLPCKEVFFRGKVYSSEKVFTASSPDAAGGAAVRAAPFARPGFRAPRFSRTAPFFAFCLFYAPCAPPCGRAHGARAACARGGFFCADLRARKDRFCGRKGAFAGKAAHTVDIFFPAG